MRAIVFFAFFSLLTLFSFISNAEIGDSSDFLLHSDIKTIREHIFNGIPKKFKTEDRIRDAYDFAHSSAFSITNLVNSGEIYTDFPALESYINKILQKVLPVELKSDSVIHAYVIKDGDVNAFMTPSGQMFINIGLFSEVANEAELAGVLAHELAHYYKRHSLKAFFDAQTSHLNDGIIFRNAAVSKYSIQKETESDSLAMIWMSKSDYSCYSMLNTYKILERNEMKSVNTDKDLWEPEASTHPLSKKRYEKVEKFLEKNDNKKTNVFLVDETLFYELKKKANLMVLECLMTDYNYNICAEKAFKCHLFDPDNSTYIYYVLESIRRACYLNTSFWNKNFLVHRYYDTLHVEGARFKKPRQEHLFAKFDFEVLDMDVREAAKIKAKFYWKEEPKFKTNEEAFVYFYKVSKVLNNHEADFSNALSITYNKELRDKYLREYLSHENIKYKSLAESMLNSTLYRDLGGEKLSILSTLYYAVKQGDNFIIIPNENNDDMNSQMISSASKSLKGRQLIYKEDLKKQSIELYRRISKLEDFSFWQTISLGEKLQFHVLDPSFYDLFLEYKVNEIEFINMLITDIQPKKKDVESYRNLVETPITTYFTETESNRYSLTYITSVREVPDGVMKVRLWDRETKIKKGISIFSFVPFEIFSKIEKKESEAANQDYMYRRN